MSNWRRKQIQETARSTRIGTAVTVALGALGAGGTLFGLVEVLSGAAGRLPDFIAGGFSVLGFLLSVIGWGLGRGLQVSASVRAVPPLGSRSLRWVRGLLPGDEGAVWWGEVTSCLAETHDPGERRRYVRSYRRGVPRLIWTSWSEHLSGSRQRELL